MLRLIISFIFGILLCGCTYLPGMKEPAPVLPLSSNLTGQVQPHFIPIDVALIQHMSAYHTGYYYRVGPLDVLEIHVWNHPEFNLPYGQGTPTNQGTLEQNVNGINGALTPPVVPVGYLIGPDGNIFFPLVGSVTVVGKTVEQIREELSYLLKKYIPHPQVYVRVSGFRSQKVYIMGEVLRPGMQPITDAPLSVTDAINLVGGIDPTYADASHIFVIRGNYACPEVFWLDARSPNALLLAEQFQLHSHDIIFVSTTDVAKFSRVMNQILPSIQTLWYTGALIRAR